MRNKRLKRPECPGRADQQDHARSLLVDPVNDADITGWRPACLCQVAARPVPEACRVPDPASAASARPAGLSMIKMSRSSYSTLIRRAVVSGRRPAGLVREWRLRLDFACGVEARLAGDVNLPAPHRPIGPSPRQAESLRDSLIQTHRDDRHFAFDTVVPILPDVRSLRPAVSSVTNRLRRSISIDRTDHRWQACPLPDLLTVRPESHHRDRSASIGLR